MQRHRGGGDDRKALLPRPRCPPHPQLLRPQARSALGAVLTPAQFDLESPDSDLVSKDAHELYRQITRHPLPPLPLKSSSPSTCSPPTRSSSIFRPPPTPCSVLLEPCPFPVQQTPLLPLPHIRMEWLSFAASIPSYSHCPHGLSTNEFVDVSGRAAAMSLSLRLRPHASAVSTLVFHPQPSPTIAPFPTLSQNIPPVQLHPGTLTFSVTNIATPFFEIDELELVLSSWFSSAEAYYGLEEGSVPAPATTTATTKSFSSSQPSRSPPSVPRTSIPAHTRPIQNESIAERFILPSKQSNISSSPRDRIRKESISINNPNSSPSPTTSPRQRKLSLNSSSPPSSIVSQGPFLTNSTAMGVGFLLAGGGTTAPNTATTPLPIPWPNLKSNTISSPSSSYPSVSLRTGPGSGSNPAPPLSPLVSHPPPLIGPATITTGGRPSA